MLVDYHTHLLGHQHRRGSADDIREFLAQAVKKNISEIAFTDHDRYHEDFNFDLIREVAQEFAELEVRTSVEMDYRPGKEEEIGEFLQELDLDFAIGSVHEIDGWPFDHPDYIEEFDKWEIDELYRKYFEMINSSVKSGLFEVIGHIDLIKLFGHRPEEDIVELITPTLELIADKDLVIEVNSNGMNKNVEEFYPAYSILEKAYQLDVKVTMSSDAHRAERVGEYLNEIREMLLDIGYSEIAVFKNRKRKMVKL